MIKAFIFDMDGVLVDTQTALDVDEFLFLKKVTNDRWTKKHQEAIHGMSLEDVYRLLVKEFGFKMNKKTFLNEYDEVNKIIYQKKAQLIPGSLDFLRKVSAQKYKIALASSASHKLINVILRRFNLKKYFDTIISSDDVYGKGKPEPDIFLMASQKLRIPQQQCVVIEDSSNGVKTAKRAWMHCVGYNGQGTSKNQNLTLADITLGTFKGINMNFLVSNLLQKTPESIEKISMGNDSFYLALSEMVNKSDYYSDFLLEQLVKLCARMSKRQLNVLEIGTGRGYLSIILAKKYPNIKHIVATDIDQHAASLAYTNVLLNSLEHIIEVRKGSLFQSIKQNEKFDILISVPPQIPVTKQQLMTLDFPISSYHFTTSVGGSDGQTIIQKLIRHAPRYLTAGGFFALVQADFSQPEKTLRQIENNGFKPFKIAKREKLLNETTLTKLLKENIEKKGYLFKKNLKGDYYFNLVSILAYKQ